MDNSDQTDLLSEQLGAHFGLNADPFSPGTSVFYEGAQRMHNIETLRHLAIFGDMVLLLTGEIGAGKTSLIERFSVLHGSEVNIMVMSTRADASSSSSVLHLAMLSNLQRIENEPARQTLTRLIQKYELDFQQHGRRTLFIIDDAEQLPKEELRLYFTVFRDQPQDSGVIVLLVGLPSLVEQAVAGSNIGRVEWLHQVQLKPLSGSETLEYLQLRLNFAGYTDHLTLTDSQSQLLIEKGSGLPGRINKIFGSVVLGDGSVKTKEPKSGNVSQRVLFSIAALLLLSFAFVSYQHGLFESGSDSSEMAGSARLVTEIEIPQEPLQEESARRALMIDKALEESQGVKVPDDIGGLSKVDKSDFKNEPRELEQVDSSSEEMSESSDLPEPLKEELKQVNVEVEKPEPIQKFSPFFRSRDWVTKQPSSYFSAQVLGSYNENTVLEFIEGSGVVKEKLVYLETSYKSRRWYVVIYGQYATKKAAREAVAQAPKVIRKEKPWLRQYEGILKTYPKHD